MAFFEDEYKNRIKWIDILKGFAIVMVMYGHRVYNADYEALSIVRAEVYSFHVPLLFFLSGYVFNVSHYTSFRKFINKKIKSLIIPMVIFSIITIAFDYIYYGMIVGVKSNATKDFIINRMIGIVFQCRKSPYMGLLWFLPALFLICILMYWIIKVAAESTFKIFSISCAFVAIGLVCISLFSTMLPWYVDNSCIALMFFALGYISKKDRWLEKINNKQYLLLFIIPNIVSMYLNYKCLGNQSVDLYLNRIGNPLLYLLESISGIFLVVGLFYKVEKNRCLLYIGRNSLIYYCLLDLMIFIPDIILYNILHIDASNMGYQSIIINTLYVLILCITIFPISEFINVKIPFIKGKF